MTGTIRVLPPEVVNQIAAGEVVERPFSVVKELVENSLDSGASKVRIEIEGGGADRIRIVDDGRGFTQADLALAFVSHATSKLSVLADLDHILSLGFRGEALASIGSVSRAMIRSRTASGEHGFEISCEGGAISPVRPCACPPGSIVEVRDLFHNTPARRRFLKTANAERARIHGMLTRLSLGRLDVDFTLMAEGREVLRLPAGDDLAARVRRSFGRDLAESLRPVHRSAGKVVVDGLVGDPDAARRDSTCEILLVNGRVVRDRSISAAIKTAFRDHLVHGRHPVWFLRLTVPPDEVDVNVHPTKSEVRFANARLVAGLLHDTVRALLEGGEGRPMDTLSIAPNLPKARSGFVSPGGDIFGRPLLPPMPVAKDRAYEVREPIPSGAPPMAPVERTHDRMCGGETAPVLDPTGARSGAVAPPSSPASPREQPHPFADLPSRFLQVHGLYLVFETDSGLTIVDQHALHERVLYEQLRNQGQRRARTIQRLLVPDVVELLPADKQWLLEHQQVLAEEGFLVDDFGGLAVAIQGLPAVLSKASPRRLLETFLSGDGESDARPSTREAIIERFHSMACRGAVMSGDRLSEPEIRALLETAAGLEHPHHCPHGRPTTVTFGRGELERYFRRRV